MNENIKVRWLTDYEQTKVAPKTLSSQVINEDGTLFKDEVNSSIATLSDRVNQVSDAIDNKANKTDIVQSNWNQNDETANDYIKNRTHYLTEYSSYSSNVIETPVGGMQLLMDLSSASSNFLKAISYENITSDYTKATYWFSLSGETYLSSLKRWATLYSLINNKPQRINSMDEKNYSYTIGTAFIVYVIQDISFLTESDKERFVTNGIYLWLKDEETAAIYRNLRWLCEKIVRLEKYYLPADTVYTSDLATVATTGDYNDLLNVPEIATDEEILEMIAQEDMLPVVADSDGSLLSDENENILLW